MTLDQFLARNRDYLQCQLIANEPDLEAYWRFYAEGVLQLSPMDRATLQRITFQVAQLPAWWAALVLHLLDAVLAAPTGLQERPRGSPGHVGLAAWEQCPGQATAATVRDG
jgi:hypothetical protein